MYHFSVFVVLSLEMYMHLQQKALFLAKRHKSLAIQILPLTSYFSITQEGKLHLKRAQDILCFKHLWINLQCHTEIFFFFCLGQKAFVIGLF